MNTGSTCMGKVSSTAKSVMMYRCDTSLKLNNLQLLAETALKIAKTITI